MADAKDKVKGKIENAAGAAKDTVDNVAGKTRKGVKKAGEVVKDAGQKVKDAGKQG